MESLVPDVLDTILPNILKISYTNEVIVNLGNELTPTSVKTEPTLEWPTDDGALYTLSMIDPDAPNSREFKHWLVINIPGLDIKSGQTLADYIGSGPPRGSGLHRYVFVVYKQPNRIETNEKTVHNRSIDGRKGFNIRDFARNHSLGEPIAGNFFQAKFDRYVPVLYAQFGLAMIKKRCTIM